MSCGVTWCVFFQPHCLPMRRAMVARVPLSVPLGSRMVAATRSLTFGAAAEGGWPLAFWCCGRWRVRRWGRLFCGGDRLRRTSRRSTFLTLPACLDTPWTPALGSARQMRLLLCVPLSPKRATRPSTRSIDGGSELVSWIDYMRVSVVSSHLLDTVLLGVLALVTCTVECAVLSRLRFCVLAGFGERGPAGLRSPSPVWTGYE